MEVAQTERCLWTSVLWPLGTSAAPGDYLCLDSDKAQQAGAWEEQNWQRLAKGTSFSVLHRARATCSMQIQAKRHSRLLCYLRLVSVANALSKGYKSAEPRGLQASQSTALACVQRGLSAARVSRRLSDRFGFLIN